MCAGQRGWAAVTATARGAGFGNWVGPEGLNTSLASGDLELASGVGECASRASPAPSRSRDRGAWCWEQLGGGGWRLLRCGVVLLPEEAGVAVADGYQLLEEGGGIAWFELVSDRAVVVGVERAVGTEGEVEG